MTENTHYLRIAFWIAREYMGTLDEGEKEELQRWYEESDENRQLYQQIMSAQQRKERDEYVSSLDVDRAWGTVKNRIVKPEEKVCKKADRWVWIKVAASFILLLGITALLFYWSESGGKLPDELALTGSYKAILITERGEHLILQDTTLKEIHFKNGGLASNSGQWIKYFIPDSISSDSIEIYNTIVVPVGGEYQLSLADGTTIWLNSKTELRFPLTFRSDKRRVYLKGEAYFQVYKDSLRSFVVNAADRVSIEVLGTEFNVQAYEDEETVQTTLNNGRVRVSDGEKIVVLKPDDQAIYNLQERTLNTCTVNASQYSAWKEGKFIFEDADLESIMNRLARWYDLEVFFSTPDLKMYHFTGDLEKYEDFRIVFRMMEKATDIRFQVKGKTVVVMNK